MGEKQDWTQPRAMALPPKGSSVVRFPITSLRTPSGSAGRSGGTSLGAPVQAKGMFGYVYLVKERRTWGTYYKLHWSILRQHKSRLPVFGFAAYIP